MKTLSLLVLFIVFYGGLAAACYGLSLVYEPLGWVFGGISVSMIAGGVYKKLNEKGLL